MTARPPVSPLVLIRSAGEMGSAIAWRLYRSNIRQLCLVDLANPLCVRRTVSFCPALEQGSAAVENVEAVAVRAGAAVREAWQRDKIAVMRTLDWADVTGLAPDVIVDAILAKRNLGTRKDEAALVVGLGPGFTAGVDCHLVIETDRGHDLGRIIETGRAKPDTGVPGNIAGFTAERILRAPCAGTFKSDRRIGDRVAKDQAIGNVEGVPIAAKLDGVLRGLIRTGTGVTTGLKLGDVDPRGDLAYCHTISDKARAIAGSVLEAVMRHFNHPAEPECPGGHDGNQ